MPKSWLSVHQCWTRVQRQTHGGERKRLYYFARQRRQHSRLVPKDLYLPPWWIARGYIVRQGSVIKIQSILKEINPEYSLEGLMLKLKLQYFGNLMQRADSLEKTLMLGKIEGRRRRGQQKLRWLNGITKSIDMSLSKLWEIIKVREAWFAPVHRLTKILMQLSYWTTSNNLTFRFFYKVSKGWDYW